MKKVLKLNNFYRFYSSDSKLFQVKQICEHIPKLNSYDQVLQESKKFVEIYSELPPEIKSGVIGYLAKEYGVDHEKIKSSIAR